MAIAWPGTYTRLKEGQDMIPTLPGGSLGSKKLPDTNTSLQPGRNDNKQVTSTSNFFTNAYDWGADDVGPKTTTFKPLVKKDKQNRVD